MPSVDRTHVLIIKLGAMGDVVQAAKAYRDLRDHHPDAMITILTGPLYKELIERCPWVDRVWSDPRAPRWRLDKMVRLRAKLRAGHFHRVYDLQNSGRTASYYRWFLSGVPWSGTAPGCSHPHKHPAPKRLPGLERMAGQLADAGLAVRHTLAPDLTWAAEDVTRKLRQAGIATPITNHSFRATGITNYLRNGGTREKAQQMANHSSARTTQLYDRREDEVTVQEIEKVRFERIDVDVGGF